MKKHRGVNVDFWTDDKVVALTPLARLLFLGSWHYCCDSGHLEASPRELKRKVLPDDACEPEALIEEIVAQGLMQRDEEGHLSVPKLPEHQKIDKRYAIRCERCEEPPSPRGGPKGTTRGAHEDPQESHARTTRAPRAEGDGEGDGEGEGEGVQGGDAPKAPRKRGSRLPDIFPVSEEMSAWAKEKAADVEIEREHEVFCDYWRGVSGARGVKTDWVATWRNWMRRTQGDLDKRKPAGDTAGLPDWMLA